MNKFNAKAYAKELKKAHPDTTNFTVRVVDDDLALVINVYAGTPENVTDGEATLIGRHDTGLDGGEYSPETHALADQLVAALDDLIVDAEKYEEAA